METVETEEVLKIAEADLRRRLALARPAVDAQIQETLHICQQRLKEAGESSSGPDKQFLVTEGSLRQLLLDDSPALRRDTEHLAELIKELVKFEREKAGLDKPSGTIELLPNKDKKSPSDPDLTGWGRVAGRQYRAAAWLASSGDKLKISLLPRKLT